MAHAKEEIKAVNAEHDYATKKWGTEFDSKNTLNDWHTYATMYGADACRMTHIGDPDKQYAFLIKAAGLYLNAATHVRTGSVARRHYDPKKKKAKK